MQKGNKSAPELPVFFKGLRSMTLSSFSLSLNWKLEWEKHPRHGKQKLYGNSQKEKNLLEALASIGIIGGAQLSRIFNVDKPAKRKMAHEGKIIPHIIYKEKQPVPIFTLGPTGAAMISLESYINQYWMEYNVPEVLKRLLYFELYRKFPKAKILPALPPFVGTIRFHDHLYYVYVVRGDINDLLMHLKWKASAERMFVVTESLNHLQPLHIYAEDLRVRVTTDDDLKGNFNNLFYHWASGRWEKENKMNRKERLFICRKEDAVWDC